MRVESHGSSRSVEESVEILCVASMFDRKHVRATGTAHIGPKYEQKAGVVVIVGSLVCWQGDVYDLVELDSGLHSSVVVLVVRKPSVHCPVCGENHKEKTLRLYTVKLVNGGTVPPERRSDKIDDTTSFAPAEK